jgi:hypothetical protein
MNLECEGGYEDWDRMAAWLKAFEAEYHRLRPFDMLHLPALSPNAGAWDGYGKLLGAGPGESYDVIDMHVYTMDLGLLQAVYTAAGACIIAVTEYNQVGPNAFMSSLPTYVESASWFILSGMDDQRQYWLIENPQAYEEIKSWPRFGNVPRPPQEEEVSLVEQYPAQYSEWVNAGGVENNFRKHLLGIGSIPVTLADCQFLASEAVASTRQTEAAIKAVPFGVPNP